MVTDLAAAAGEDLATYRLVNSKFPPIVIFDDVANSADFDALYQIQALTNPRLQNEVGRLELVNRAEIPFGIAGCSYATAPFTHVNPEGSRFSDGSFGALYLADRVTTALAEVKHHQEAYWQKVEGLGFDRFVFRGLKCTFNDAGVLDATELPMNDPIYDSGSYAASRVLGGQLKAQKIPGLRYHSVRASGQVCWALFSPRPVKSIIQTAHYEMIWNDRVMSVNEIRSTHI